MIEAPMKYYCILILSLFTAVLRGEIQLIAPSDHSVVTLLPRNQKNIMSIPTHDERFTALEADRQQKKTYFALKAIWCASQPVKFQWKCTSKERGPYKILISETEDFAEPQVLFAVRDPKTKSWQCHAIATGYSGNFKIGQKYFWKVIGYKDFRKGTKTESAVFTFTTEDLPPRWIIIEGRVKNIRDLGGYCTNDGKKVKQGMIFRGQGLNDNSIDHEIPGSNRLTLNDQQYFLDILKIRTDLDLRNSYETGKLKQSPLGKTVKLISIPSPAYKELFQSKWKHAVAACFRVFCDKDNYPVYLHCRAGADRTGALAFILNGILGVQEQKLAIDWEHTFYPNLPDKQAQGNPDFWCRYQHLTDGFSKYGKNTDSLQKRLEHYLADCGIRQEEINAFRSIMLE